MGLWDGMSKAQVSERGNYFKAPAILMLEIVKTIAKDTRKSGKCFIAEFKVLESNHPDHPVGSTGTWMQKLQDKDVAFPSIKEFIAAVLGFDVRNPADKLRMTKELDPEIEVILEAATESNDLAGQRVVVETAMVKTKQGKDFTQHRWSPAPK